MQISLVQPLSDKIKLIQPPSMAVWLWFQGWVTEVTDDPKGGGIVTLAPLPRDDNLQHISKYVHKYTFLQKQILYSKICHIIQAIYSTLFF